MRILFCLVALLFTAAPVHAKKRSSPFAKARRAMIKELGSRLSDEVPSKLVFTDDGRLGLVILALLPPRTVVRS